MHRIQILQFVAVLNVFILILQLEVVSYLLNEFREKTAHVINAAKSFEYSLNIVSV